MFNLSNIRPNEGAHRPRKRVGRGPGSGLGKTSGRGHKGQKARAGHKKSPWFEGGQTPLYRRLPKRGFYNPFRVSYQLVNLEALEKAFSDGDEVSPESLRAKGLIRKSGPVKLLGRGELTRNLRVKVDACSGSAAKAVEAAGGTLEVIKGADEEKED